MNFTYRRTWKQYPSFEEPENNPLHKLRLIQRRAQGLRTQLRLEQRPLKSKDGNGKFHENISM